MSLSLTNYIVKEFLFVFPLYRAWRYIVGDILKFEDICRLSSKKNNPQFQKPEGKQWYSFCENYASSHKK